MDRDEKPHKVVKKKSYSPTQRVARCNRKIATYLRKIDRLRDLIDEQATLRAELMDHIKNFENATGTKPPRYQQGETRENKDR